MFVYLCIGVFWNLLCKNNKYLRETWGEGGIKEELLVFCSIIKIFLCLFVRKRETQPWEGCQGGE